MFSLKETLLYKRYKEDVEHIHKNKWYMSEKVGYDVGYEKALLDWIIYHKNKKQLDNK